MTLFGQITQTVSQAAQTLVGGVSKTVRPLLDIRARAANEDEIFRSLGDHVSAYTRVAIPAQVLYFDPVRQTVTAQPSIPEKWIAPQTGQPQWVYIQPIPDIPVVFPGGGNYMTTFPIQPGDEVLLVFADLCIDSWFTSGGGPWNDKRRHDLSDAIAIPGLRNQTRVLPDFNTTGAEFRAVGEVGAFGPAKFSIDTMDLVSNGIPATYGRTKMEANGASVTCTMSNTTVIVDGVPVEVPTPTIEFVGKIVGI